jgi:hypothetical protein
MNVTASRNLHPLRPPTSHAPAFTGGLERLIQSNLSNNDVGIDEYQLNGKDIGKLPDAARKFYFAQVKDARDNDGTPAAYQFDLSEVNKNLGGKAFAVRWTSEDGQMDRIWLYGQNGTKLAKGSTNDAGTNLTWTKL